MTPNTFRTAALFTVTLACGPGPDWRTNGFSLRLEWGTDTLPHGRFLPLSRMLRL